MKRNKLFINVVVLVLSFILSVSNVSANSFKSSYEEYTFYNATITYQKKDISTLLDLYRNGELTADGLIKKLIVQSTCEFYYEGNTIYITCYDTNSDNQVYSIMIDNDEKIIKIDFLDGNFDKKDINKISIKSIISSIDNRIKDKKVLIKDSGVQQDEYSYTYYSCVGANNWAVMCYNNTNENNPGYVYLCIRM